MRLRLNAVLRLPGACTFFLTMLLALPNIAYPAVYINKTRIIVDEAQYEATFQVRNEDNTTILLQTWLDNGDIAAKPEDITVPFIITPPLFRSEPGRSHTFRLLFTGEKNSVPTDREKVYWLNVLEIPPKSKSVHNQIQLQMAFRSRIKVFYRPAALKQVNIHNEATKLRARVERSSANRQVVRVDNPSPVHITLLSLAINGGPKIMQIPQDGMIAPFSSIQVPYTGATASGSVTLAFEYLDDYGEIQTCCDIKN